MMNPMKLLQIQGAWNKFRDNHPKFPLFINAVAKEGLRENTVIEIAVTTPEGKTYNTNLKLCASDMELMETIKDLAMQK